MRGEGESTVAKDESNLIVRATQLVYTSAGLSMPPLKFSCENAIPCGAGLGSSSAAIIAGIVAGYALLGKDISDAEESLLQLAAQLENHVDNIAPCLHGGFRIGLHAGGRWRTSSVNIPTGLKAVVFVPSASAGLGGAGSAGKTEQVRAILTPEVTREDAVFNISRAALLVNAFNTSNWKDMRFATQDALHQVLLGRLSLRCVVYPSRLLL